MKTIPLRQARNRLMVLLFVLAWLSSFVSEDAQAQSDYQQITSRFGHYLVKSNFTDRFLQQLNYQPPAFLKSNWAAFPNTRKLETAYKAAKSVSVRNGEEFMALLNQSMSQKYNSFQIEHGRKSSGSVTRKVSFANPRTKRGLDKITIPSKFNKELRAVSRYVDNGALGGPYGVLRKMGHSKDAIYRYLQKSASTGEALRRGLDDAPQPPSKNERVNTLKQELKQKYNSARTDPALNTDTRSRTSPRQSSMNPRRTYRSKVSPVTVSNYERYKKTNYPRRRYVKFGRMTRSARGFGGVVFGNKVKDETGLGKIDFIRFIPNENYEYKGLSTGSLELVFKNGQEYLITDIYLEDILAAYKIVYGYNYQNNRLNLQINYKKGQGIGLAGIGVRDSLVQGNLVVHPAIANLKLGWATIFIDVLPIAYNEIPYHKRDLISIKNWFRYDRPDSSYKIVDVPMKVSLEDGQLQILPIKESNPKAYITMQGFYKKYSLRVNSQVGEKGKEEEMFYKNVKVLSEHFQEIHRVNEFAKVFALFRWIKKKASYQLNTKKIKKIFTSLDQLVKKYNEPAYIRVNYYARIIKD